MTTMPKGQPRSVPDPEGELYDADGRLLAKATGTAVPTPFQRYKA